jgi:hypothetical protein
MYGGTNLPQGYHIQNTTANLDYPNQSTFCEYCRDWAFQGNVTGTGQWIGTPNTFGTIAATGQWSGSMIWMSGANVQFHNQGTYNYLDVNLNPRPVNISGSTTYSTAAPYTTITEAEDMCGCCPTDALGNYTSVGLEITYLPSPHNGVWMGPTV